MAVDVEIDVDLLKSEIKKTYSSVSQEPEKDFIFPTGRAWAQDLDYPPELANVPDARGRVVRRRREPVAARPARAGRARARPRLRCGHGLARRRPDGRREGSVTGIDMTPEMLAKARAAAAEMGATNVEFVESETEQLPFRGRELRRRDLERRHRPDPRQGRRLRRALSRARSRRADADRRRHDPEPGQRRGTTEHRPLDRLNCRGAAGSSVREAPGAARLRADRDRQLVDTYARSKFEDTRRKAQKFGARGTTVKAYKA